MGLWCPGTEAMAIARVGDTVAAADGRVQLGADVGDVDARAQEIGGSTAAGRKLAVLFLGAGEAGDPAAARVTRADMRDVDAVLRGLARTSVDGTVTTADGGERQRAARRRPVLADTEPVAPPVLAGAESVG